MAFSLMPLPQIRIEPNQLDFSPVSNALAGYAKGQERAYEGETGKMIGNALAGDDLQGARRIAAQRGDLDTNLGLAKFGMAQKAEAREETAFQDQRREKGVMQLAKVGQAILDEPDPAKQSDMFGRLMKLPQVAEAWKTAGMPAELADDPVVFSRYVTKLAGPYRDPLTTALTKSEIEKNLAQAGEQFQPIPESAPGVFSKRTGEVKTLPGGADPTQRIIIKKAAEKEGEAIGDARVVLPEVLRSGESMLNQIDALIGNPERGIPGDKRLDSVVGPFDAHPWVPTISGKSQATLARIAQLQGGTFLQAYKMLRGGGAIANIESEKATQALNRLTNLRQDEKSYRDAVAEFRSEIVKLMDAARQQAKLPTGQSATTPGAATPDRPDPLGIR